MLTVTGTVEFLVIVALTFFIEHKKLNAEDRVLEIAKMLSGENPKESAIQNAKELLQN